MIPIYSICVSCDKRSSFCNNSQLISRHSIYLFAYHVVHNLLEIDTERIVSQLHTHFCDNNN